MVEIKDAKKIAIKIPRVSNQSKSRNKKTTFMAKATKRILIMGSPKDSKSKRIKLFCFFSVKTLAPFNFLCTSTSFLFKPFMSIRSIT